MGSMVYALLAVNLFCFYQLAYISSATHTHTWQNLRSSLNWWEGFSFLHHCTSSPPPLRSSLATGLCEYIHKIGFLTWEGQVEKYCLNQERGRTCTLGLMGNPSLSLQRGYFICLVPNFHSPNHWCVADTVNLGDGWSQLNHQECYPACSGKFSHQ